MKIQERRNLRVSRVGDFREDKILREKKEELFIPSCRLLRRGAIPGGRRGGGGRREIGGLEAKVEVWGGGEGESEEGLVWVIAGRGRVDGGEP